MPTPDILTVTLNPAVDIATSTARLEPTHKLRCEAAHRFPGGGGINVARVVQRLGGDCLALYLAGGIVGQQLRRLAERERLVSHCLPIADETRECFSVRESSTGREYRFVLPGPQVQASEWQACLDYVAKAPQPPRFVVLSGSLPPGVPVDAYARLAEVANARGSRVVLDSSGLALANALQRGVYLVKPSLRELCDLSGRPLADEAQWRAAAQEIVQDGRAQIVAVSLGEQGALLVTAQGAWRVDALAVPVATTTGAGDSFVGAMVWALSRDPDVAAALRMAVAAASAALLSVGTSLCRPEDVERLLPQVVVHRIAD